MARTAAMSKWDFYFQLNSHRLLQDKKEGYIEPIFLDIRHWWHGDKTL